MHVSGAAARGRRTCISRSCTARRAPSRSGGLRHAMRARAAIGVATRVVRASQHKIPGRTKGGPHGQAHRADRAGLYPHRKAVALLDEKAIPYRYREYTREPLTEGEIREILRLLGSPA